MFKACVNSGKAGFGVHCKLICVDSFQKTKILYGVILIQFVEFNKTFVATKRIANKPTNQQTSKFFPKKI